MYITWITSENCQNTVIVEDKFADTHFFRPNFTQKVSSKSVTSWSAHIAIPYHPLWDWKCFDIRPYDLITQSCFCCFHIRILTLGYKELQIGKQIFKPSNQWCNCADICYGSKLLDVRYPHEETGSHDERVCKLKCNMGVHCLWFKSKYGSVDIFYFQKCSWKLGTIRSSDLVSFSVTGEPKLPLLRNRLTLSSASWFYFRLNHSIKCL